MTWKMFKRNGWNYLECGDNCLKSDENCLKEWRRNCLKNDGRCLNLGENCLKMMWEMFKRSEGIA